MSETVDPDTELSEEQVAAKWLEMAPLIDRMAERIQDPADFPVSLGSSLSGDDAKSNPYCVSHAALMCLVSGVDHLHAAKSLVLDLQLLYASAAYSSFSALLGRLLAPPSFGLFDGVDGESFEFGGQLAEAAGVVEPVPVTVELLRG